MRALPTSSSLCRACGRAFSAGSVSVPRGIVGAMTNEERQTAYRAAWVPDDDPQRPWEDAAALAVEWTRVRARELGRLPLLVTFSFQNGEGVDAFRGLERITTRSSQSAGAMGARPVLAYVPEQRVLELAHRRARGATLCVVESVSFPIHGWARESAAVNLLDGSVLPPLDPALATGLDRLQRAGNNGWGDQPGKRDATRLLGELRLNLDCAEVFGYVLARGASERGVTNLRKIAQKIGFE